MVYINPPFIDDDDILRPPTETTRVAMCAMNLFAGSRAFDVELQRGNGSSGAFETIHIIKGYNFSIWQKKYTYMDTDLPTGVGLFRYRARQIRSDAIPGPYTTPKTALATIIDMSAAEYLSIIGGGDFDVTSSTLNIDDISPFDGDGIFI